MVVLVKDEPFSYQPFERISEMQPSEIFSRDGSGNSCVGSDPPYSPHLDNNTDVEDYLSETDLSDAAVPAMGDSGWGGRDESLAGLKSSGSNTQPHRSSKWSMISNVLGFISTISQEAMLDNVSHILDIPYLRIPAAERTQEQLTRMYEQLKNNSLFLKLGLNIASNFKGGIKLMSQVDVLVCSLYLFLLHSP